MLNSGSHLPHGPLCSSCLSSLTAANAVASRASSRLPRASATPTSETMSPLRVETTHTRTSTRCLEPPLQAPRRATSRMATLRRDEKMMRLSADRAWTPMALLRTRRVPDGLPRKSGHRTPKAGQCSWRTAILVSVALNEAICPELRTEGGPKRTADSQMRKFDKASCHLHTSMRPRRTVRHHMVARSICRIRRRTGVGTDEMSG